MSNEETNANDDALAVNCPRCDSGPGEPCWTVAKRYSHPRDGNPSGALSIIHGERRRAALGREAS